jgi:hypothetical protein
MIHLVERQHDTINGEITNSQFAKQYVYVEGNEIWSSNDENDKVRIFDCCTTHNGEHRYGLIGINDLEEVLDCYGKEGGEWYAIPESRLCENFPDATSLNNMLNKAWEDRHEYSIELTDGTMAYPSRMNYDLVATLDGSVCFWLVWYSEYTTTDGIKFPGLRNKYLYHGDLDGGMRIVDTWLPEYVALAKKKITDKRERYLCHNGKVLRENIRYDGLYCCGDFALCTYVDDDYLSGWSNEWQARSGVSSVNGVERKWTPNPGWGDRMPPSASDRATWDYYKAVYPGFKVDVFYKGNFVGTFDLSDANSPIHYDHLGIGIVWLWMMSFRDYGWRNDIGRAPWSLEGTPKCADRKLLIPFDGGITTCVGDGFEREVFS